MSADESEARFTHLAELLASAVHDLRGQLGIITLTASCLGRSIEADDLPRQKGRILRAAARMTARVNDLVDAAAIETGQLRVQPAAVEVRPLLEECLEQARPAAQSREVALELDAPAGARALCDRARIARVLAALLEHAVRAAPAGSRVTLGAEPVPEGIRLAVRDQGPGIPPAEQERLFQRPARGKELGLFVAQGIALAHGTRVEVVESTPDQGGRLSLCLPLATDR